ncbi:uncharacterized protein SCHCODRAFT_02515873 [Schizophyllum commune H4-8]|nr:uncharacterized protein SCHCODRAFT_02515873 [Schizophyllum commune H4-8]KAI5886759.1 hypothetical protein SCHCODRAFT_02515873 [Schizophyllum commune H4-8]
MRPSPSWQTSSSLDRLADEHVVAADALIVARSTGSRVLSLARSIDRRTSSSLASTGGRATPSLARRTRSSLALMADALVARSAQARRLAHLADALIARPHGSRAHRRSLDGRTRSSLDRLARQTRSSSLDWRPRSSLSLARQTRSSSLARLADAHVVARSPGRTRYIARLADALLVALIAGRARRPLDGRAHRSIHRRTRPSLARLGRRAHRSLDWHTSSSSPRSIDWGACRSRYRQHALIARSLDWSDALPRRPFAQQAAASAVTRSTSRRPHRSRD